MKAFTVESSSKDDSTKRHHGIRHTPMNAKKSFAVFPTGIPFIQRKPDCSCDGSCPRCSGMIQPKLTIGQPDDKYEQEADRVADQVMRMPEPTVQRKAGCLSCGDLDEEQIQTKAIGDRITPLVQRQVEKEEEEEEVQPKLNDNNQIQRQVEEEPEEEEEEPVQAKSLGNKSHPTANIIQRRIQSINGSGRPLSASNRAFFEPRFGRDFSGVRVHTDSYAAGLARSVNAKAFTRGKDIVFGSGQYSPGSSSGKRLLAHELTHVLQQGGSRSGSPDKLQRTVLNTAFSCPANTAGAPNNPLAEMQAIDARAQQMAMGLSNILWLDSILVLDPSIPWTEFIPYTLYFGWPEAVGGGFRNRFTGAIRPTRRQAASEEMARLSDRFNTLATYLAGPIRYRCRQVGQLVMFGGCTDRCKAHYLAITCIPTDNRTIVICPGFWALNNRDQQAGVIIHETVHMRFNFKSEDSATLAQRGRNAECYATFAAQHYNFIPSDPSCPLMP